MGDNVTTWRLTRWSALEGLGGAEENERTASTQDQQYTATTPSTHVNIRQQMAPMSEFLERAIVIVLMVRRCMILHNNSAITPSFIFFLQCIPLRVFISPLEGISQGRLQYSPRACQHGTCRKSWWRKNKMKIEIRNPVSVGPAEGENRIPRCLLQIRKPMGAARHQPHHRKRKT